MTRWAWAMAALAVLLDLVIWPAAAPFGRVPDTVLAVSMALAILGEGGQGLTVAVACGMAVDIMGGILVGLGAAVRAAVVLGLTLVAPRAGTERVWVVVALGLIGAALAWGLEQAGAAAFGVVVPMAARQVAGGMAAILVTGALFALAYLVLSSVTAGGSPPRLVGRRTTPHG